MEFLRSAKRAAIITVCLVLLFAQSQAQDETISLQIKKQTFTYAVKDAAQLNLDLYSTNSVATIKMQPCVIFVFGGGFVAGKRDDTTYQRYFQCLATHGYVVASISYRLGLKNARHLSIFNTSPLRNAINMAVEDLYDATDWLIAHADSLGIDTSKIILSGSSSGAVTVLEADFLKRNGDQVAKKSDPRFQYAGIIAFSGAILNYHHKLSWQIPPAPVLLFHGTADKIVPYNKIGFLNKGFFGSSWIAKTCKENGYPYYIYRAEGMGHEISVLPMYKQLPLILDFLDQFVVQHKPYQVDMSFKNPDEKPMLTITAKQLFRKLQAE